MTTLNDSRLGDIVANNFRAAGVFDRYGLDYCCGGKKLFSKACAEKGIDIAEVSNEIEILESRSEGSGGNKFTLWNVNFLIDYIVNNHHEYLRGIFPVLTAHSQKVAGKHGENHPEYVAIAENFGKIRAELESHLMKEEQILFPFIRQLEQLNESNGQIPANQSMTVQMPINVMESEHVAAGDILAILQKLTNNYTPPEDACMTTRTMFAELAEFENDLHQHIHLENNILFPKAVALEEKLRSAQ